MAAIYLHNAIFSPEPSQSPIPVTYSPRHSRNLSSQSSMTGSRTSQEYSYPTAPLLPAEVSGSLAYADILSRQPMHPSGPQPGWDMGLSLVGDQPTMAERIDTWERAVKRRLKWLRSIKGALELLMGERWSHKPTIAANINCFALCGRCLGNL